MSSAKWLPFCLGLNVLTRPEDLTIDNSVLDQVMAWCCQTRNHYMNLCWRSCHIVSQWDTISMTHSMHVWILKIEHIEAETKWPPFSRQHFWRISIKISLKFVPKDPINNIAALVQIMAWRRPGAKPLSEAMPVCCTVGTPYNTVPYTTGSNITRLGHGSQNSWSKLWIPVVKEILNRFPSVLLSREKASPQENSR